jgi:hypothetical protein
MVGEKDFSLFTEVYVTTKLWGLMTCYCFRDNFIWQIANAMHRAAKANENRSSDGSCHEEKLHLIMS